MGVASSEQPVGRNEGFHRQQTGRGLRVSSDSEQEGDRLCFLRPNLGNTSCKTPAHPLVLWDSTIYFYTELVFALGQTPSSVKLSAHSPTGTLGKLRP